MIIKIEWCTEDVLQQAKNRGIKLNIAEADEVLSLCESEHDCNIGINWEVIDYWINDVVERRLKNE